MAVESIALPLTEDVGELRKAVEGALQRLALRIDSGQQTRDLDLNNHQVKNVAYPTDDADAVNVAYIRRKLAENRPTLNRREQWRLQVNGSGTATGTGSSPPEWIRVESTMTLATTTIDSLVTPVAGRYYALVLHQDTTGGRLVDWGTANAYKGMAGWQPSPNPNSYSAFLFYCKASNNFQLLAPPVTGVE